ncbi:hypothetical protein GCM10010493_57780 [Streptomyces lavendulae subsp. grasserius]
MNQELRYQAGVRSASELQELVTKVIADLDADPELRRELSAYGLEPSDISSDSIDVRQESAGLDPVTASLIIAFAGPPVMDVWRHILLPRLRLRFGHDVVGEEKAD